MPARRKYAQACGTAHALDVIGDRWALLIVRELVLGPKRFTDLRDGLPGIGPNVLSQRLKELEDAGVVQKHRLPPPAGSTVYELTAWGSELEDIVIRLGRWGARTPRMPVEEESRPEWLVLGLRALYDPDGAPAPATYELRFGGDETYWARIDGSLTVGRGSARDPDAVITTDVDTFAQLVRRRLKPGAALRSKAVEVEGGRSVLEDFMELFPFPPSGPEIHG